MKIRIFILWFILLMLLTFVQYRVLHSSVFLDATPILIFLVIRESGMVKSLVFTFFLSLGVDLVFQTQHLKGIACLGQLPLVFLIISIKNNVVPYQEDFFLMGLFAVFFILDYYIFGSLSGLFGQPIELFPFWVVLYRSLVHTAIFGAVILLNIKFGGKSV